MRYLNSKRLAVSAGLLFCLSLIGCSSSKDTDEVKREDIKTLSVTGVGEVRVLPDQFVLTGAVIQQKNTTREAMNAVADIVNAVQAKASGTAALTSQEFNFASVNTVGVKDPECLLFNQEADRTNGTLREGEPRVTKKVCDDESQQASISFTFTAGPSDLAGDLLSGFSQAGAIRLNLDGYKVANIDELELKAGEKAIANAREKAERLAKSGGATIVGVLDLNAYKPTYNQRTARAPHINTFGAGESTSLVDGGDPIEVTAMNLVAGEQVISASVALEFIYE